MDSPRSPPSREVPLTYRPISVNPLWRKGFGASLLSTGRVILGCLTDT